MTGPYRAYMICTTPRSGSTMLCKLLAGTSVAGSPDSHFHTPSLEAWCKTFGVPMGPDALTRVVSRAIDRGRAGTPFFGLRMQRGSFPYFISQMAEFFPEQKTDKARIEAAFGRTLFVHLTRQDKLAQAISYVRAKQSGLWHMAADGTELERTGPPSEPLYDADLLAEKMRELTALDADWKAWFGAERIVPHHIGYDDLAANPELVLKRLLGILGKEGSAYGVPAPETARLSDQLSLDWARRFHHDRRA